MKKKTINTMILLIIYLALTISLCIFGFQKIKYQALYQEAIKQGTENTVTAIELVATCQSLGNFTSEELEDKWIDMFLKNRTNGGSQ